MILDATSGGRMMWFDKDPEGVLFVDRRVVPPGSIVQQPLWSVNPDVKADNRSLPYKDNSFELVVFDPPHTTISEDSIIGTKYGKLTDLHEVVAGINECLRVSNGFVVFKWAETEFPLSAILEHVTHLPLFGHTTAKSGLTMWVMFDARTQ